MKKKFICTVCGYIHEGNEAPEKCPMCGVPASKFKELTSDDSLSFVAFVNISANGANKLLLHNSRYLNCYVYVMS